MDDQDLIGIIPAVIVPMRADFSIDFAALSASGMGRKPVSG
jgi:dihydrodipicolinate synthase/N-acetylneuraminate lyase